MRRIMVATDGSEGADRAIDIAVAIAKATGASLAILTVGGNLSSEEMRQLARVEKDIGDALESVSNAVLRRGPKNERNGSASRPSTREPHGAIPQKPLSKQFDVSKSMPS